MSDWIRRSWLCLAMRADEVPPGIQARLLGLEDCKTRAPLARSSLNLTHLLALLI
jgi:hypothetical protein